jgi:hypothetical protein
MKKYFYIILAVLLFVSIPALAATRIDMLGFPNSSNISPVEVDSDRVVSIANDSGLKLPYERATASDTLTAADSGKTISVNCPAGDCEFDLPDAKAGMFFRFINELRTAFIVDPGASDYIRWSGDTGDGSVLAVGQSIKGTGDTYSTLTIYCTQDNYWTVEEMLGFKAN